MKRGRFIITTLAVLALVLFAGHYAWSSSREPQDVAVELASDLDRLSIAAAIGAAMGWEEKEQEEFAATHVQIQWAAWNSELMGIFADQYDWQDAEKEAFATQSAQYFNADNDFLSRVYVPGTYALRDDMSAAQVADILTVRVKEEAGNDLRQYIADRLEKEPMEKVAVLVRKEVELLPDIAPLPARDIDLIKDGSNVYLRFTTMYHNQGRGPLELVPDPALIDVRGVDVERKVFQRIYHPDGGYRDKLVGVFYWHQPHLHYHFKDFVEYDLAAVDAPAAPNLSGVLVKSTFCVRDISRTDLDLARRAEKARYLVCGRNLQGISVGWADTYFFDYPDQRLEVQSLSSGTYKLTFRANPEGVFDELDSGNNTASVTFKMDMENLKVEVLEEYPENSPKVEHVYMEQVFD